MLDILAYPTGYILKIIYATLGFESYGLSIILLTLIVKFALQPLNNEQQKTSEKMQGIQPEMTRLQEKYAEDPEKYNEKIRELYKEKKINPLGMILPMMIQIPIMIALYKVISNPLKYMFGGIIGSFVTLPDLKSLPIDSSLVNMNFLGFDLASAPIATFQYAIANPIELSNWLFVVVPLVVGITSYFSVALSSKEQNTDGVDQRISKIQNIMFLTMPVMTAYFAMNLPAGLGLYWTVGNVFMIFQSQKYRLKSLVFKAKPCFK